MENYRESGHHGTECQPLNVVVADSKPAGTRRQLSAVDQYSRVGRKTVGGWFQRIDAEIFSTILAYQTSRGILGCCCEIGVHHGKSFIPLCLSLRNEELAVCIDLFEDQSKNLDQSGRGDRSTLFSNLKKFGVHASRVRVVQDSSENVSADRILTEAGPVRFFSVDGGHWKSIVENDLALAEATLVPGGIIALDDPFRADWPEVTFGLASWLDRSGTNIVPFACGTNKLYLCRREFADAYRECLRTDYLRLFYSKTYRSRDFDLDSYKMEIKQWDEAGFGEIFRTVMAVFFPDLLFGFRRYARAAKSAVTWR